MERGLWTAVVYVVNRGVSDSQLRWAIDEACKHASYKEIINYLTFAAENQVLTLLVERGLWEAVAMVLERGVIDRVTHSTGGRLTKHANVHHMRKSTISRY